MNAISIEKSFIDSKIIDLPMPSLKDGQTLIKVKAVGICQSDIARVFNQSAYYYPIILGHEFSGVTTHYENKATVFPIIPCMNCDECKNENYAQCKNYSYYGSRQNGGMQEYIAINDWNLMYNHNLDCEELALIEPSAVAMNACNKVGEDSESILINGCGFIALVAAQILLSKKKKVYIRNRNEQKLKFSLDNFDLIEYAGQPVDCAIDFVSTSESMNYIIETIKPHGKIISVGNPFGEVVLEKKNYSNILRKEIEIRGIWNSKRNDWNDVMGLISDKQIDVKRLITHRYDYRDFKKAFEKIRENQIKHNELIIKSILLFD